MLEKYIPKRFATAMIKHVIAATLFFPYIYSHNNNVYYQDFVLPNLFAILAMVFIFTSWKLDFKRNAIFVSGLGILLLAYNVCATYMNVKYHHWYGEQINTTISFLFFMVLLMVKDIHALIDTATIKATIHMIVASNVCAIIFRFDTGHNRLFIINNWLSAQSIKYNPSFSWLYGHKSEYGFILVLCMAFLAIHYKYFQNIFTYILSQGILLYALYLSDAYTSMVAALLIFGGQFLDYLITAKWWKKLIALITIPSAILFIAQELYSRISADRDLLTLGYRLPIWEQFVSLIQQNPHGIGKDFDCIHYRINGFSYEVEGFISTNNCHNVFLNHMFRFSIPVGGIFTAIILLILLFALKRQFRFTTIFTWIALFVPLTMDYSMLNIELPFFLITIFLFFFINNKEKK